MTTMSNNFNFQRVKKLARWCWVNDKPFNTKNFVQTFIVCVIFFQVPNIFHNEHAYVTTYGACIGLILGVYLMSGLQFNWAYSENSEAHRTLHLLPASNLEKFITRYVMGILYISFTFLCSLLIADLLQYVVGWILGRDNLRSVLLDVYSKFNVQSNPYDSRDYFLLSLGLWIHTIFLVSCNLFRNIKYNWVISAVLLVVGWFVIIFFVPKETLHTLCSTYALPCSLVLLGLSILNVWLAYKLFCNWTVIGKFINRL